MPERLAFQRKWYEELEPGLIEDTEIVRDFKNLIGYYNVDEPNLVNPEERIAAAEWYWKTVNPLDPYRPQFLLYARHIPVGDNWTRWGDVLGYDVYPCPYTGGFHSEPALSTAYYAWQLRERCRQDNKLMFFVPLANQLDPGRAPIGLSRDHMLAQAYAAIIYGSRGMMYFTLSAVVGPEAWDALRTISAQVKAMAPALLNGEIARNIKYTPDDFDPRARKFPPVNVEVFQYPDANYLLMAVNVKPFAVETEFTVGGIKHAARMFASEGQRGKGAEGQSEMVLDGETFKDKIEPYGVRAYRLRLDAAAAGAARPVEIAVAMTPVPEETAPAADVPGIIRRVMLGRNHMPNPCFAQQTNPGCPDFYRPYFCLSVDPYWGQPGKSDWFMDDTALWNGHPSLRMYKRNLADGGYKTRGMFFGAYPPVNQQPAQAVFSLHARSETPGASLWFQPPGGSPVTVKGLTPDWQRHHFAFTLPPGGDVNLGVRQFLMSPSAGAVIWINGLQLEIGGEPSEFQDDSLPLKKKAVADPDNLIPNPGAESGAAEGWSGLENLRRGELGLRRGAGHTGERICLLLARAIRH